MDRFFNWLKIFIYIALTLVVLAGIAAGAFYIYLNQFHKSSPVVKEKTHKTYQLADQQVFLIIGTDVGWPGKETPSTEETRSDTLILAIVNNKSGNVNLLSIPRDSYVQIAGKQGYDKITHAHAIGGTEMTIDTVEDFLDLDIDHYVEINYDGFVKLIDAVGGVDVDVEKRMRYVDPTQDLVIDLQPGLQHLGGNDALGYVRFRHDAKADIGRIQRQTKFIKEFYAQLSKPGMLTKVPSIAKILPQYAATDMAPQEILAYAMHFADYNKSGIHSSFIDGRPVMIDEISYWEPDLTKMQETISAMLSDNFDKPAPGPEGVTSGGITAEKSNLRVTILNGAGTPGIAKTLADKLAASGYIIVKTDNADSFSYVTTKIISNAPRANLTGLINELPGAVLEKNPSPDDDADVVIIMGQDTSR